MTATKIAGNLWFALTHPRHFYRIFAWTTLRQSTVRQRHADPLVDLFCQGYEYQQREQQWWDLRGQRIPIIRLALHNWRPRIFQRPAGTPTWITTEVSR